jgi:hypothetical protein
MNLEPKLSLGTSVAFPCAAWEQEEKLGSEVNAHFFYKKAES